MKAPQIIFVVLAVVVVVRLALRRRGRAASSPRRTGSSRRRDRRVFGDTGLVAGREIRERLRGRVFKVVTIVLFAVVAAGVVIPTIHGGSGGGKARATVAVVAGSTPLDAVLRALARPEGLTVNVISETNLSRARSALDAGRLDMVVQGTERILLKNPLSASDTSAGARYVRAVASTLGEEHAFLEAKLSSSQAGIVAGAKPLAIESLHPAKAAKTTAQATALLGLVLIFIVLTQYLTWTMMGVMEEKASRVVEVLLATVRPIQLLAGKVIGIGVVALAQATALLVFALLLAKAVGSSLVHGAAPLVMAATLVWLVLGYAFYSWVYAAAGSLAERQDQVQSLVLPLSAPLILGYIVSLVGVGSGSPSLLVKVLAYLPPTAPFAMPALVGFSQASWWQFLLSALLSVGATILVALGAARVYRSAVLKTGGRVRLRQLFGSAAH